MISETVWILEDATTNHKTVYCWIFGMESESVSFVFDIPIDDELGVWAYLVTKCDDVRDEFVMGGDFAHFFFGAEVNCESGRMLVQ